jgi:hypothetical protein
VSSDKESEAETKEEDERERRRFCGSWAAAGSWRLAAQCLVPRWGVCGVCLLAQRGGGGGAGGARSAGPLLPLFLKPSFGKLL